MNLARPAERLGMRRFANWTTHHRKTVLITWITVFIAGAFLASSLGADFKEDFTLPKSDSRSAIDLLDANFPSQAGSTAQIVFFAEDGVADPAVKERMQKAFAEIAKVKGVTGVESPYVKGVSTVSPDGKIAFATVTWADQIGQSQLEEQVDPVISAYEKARGEGLEVQGGGAPIQAATAQEGDSAELVGIVAAMIVLLIMFGSVVAMGMPIITALIAVGTASSLIVIASHAVPTAQFSTFLSVMIGLGVGIDYSLFIVTRFRQGLRDGLEPIEAVLHSVDTAGRAVLFAGITVVIALLGLFAIGVEFLYGPAIAASLTVLITMTAALTLLPSLLASVGRNIDRLRIPGRASASASPTNAPTQETRWHHWARFVQRRPWPVALIATSILIVLAIPALSLQLGVADSGTDPKDSTTRKAYDLLAKGFGPGFNGPLTIVVATNDKNGTPEELQKEVSATKGVAAASPPVPSPNGKVAIITAFPTTSPQSEKTKDLVSTLRDDVLVKYNDAGQAAHIAGVTAVFDDFSTLIAEKLPVFFAAVILLSALLLMAVFRSILIPLKAVFMNLIGIFAAFGVTVAIFQWGWGLSLLGVSGTAPIMAFLPVMLFAIVFGLSMDYEVFLMSRVHEEWEKSGDAEYAVVEGLGSTAGVITAAAVIMISLFTSFAVLSSDLTTKLFGVALATTIFLDAFLIRSALVPAVMAIMGEKAWWMPKWLDRIIPTLNVEPPEEQRES
jgi:RND superfamily putative drug exporter